MSIAEKIQDLYQRFGGLPGITIECQKELLAIGISNSAASAEVFIQGAQVSRYQRHTDEAPILFLSDDCAYKQGVSLRGGIPICWPWFGALNKNKECVTKQYSSTVIESASAHGFVREREWQVDNIRMPSNNLTIIELSYVIDGNVEEYWPFETRLSYRIEIGQQLTVNLQVENISKQSFAYSSALHSYFSVANIDNVFISNFDEIAYIDALDHWQLKKQKGDIVFDQEVDRIYQVSPQSIMLHDGQRKINIDTQGSTSTVIWNPWIEKSQKLTQFNDKDYLRMVCVETANVADNVVELAPGQTHNLSVTVG